MEVFKPGSQVERPKSPEAKESFRATLGLDFIFRRDAAGQLHAVCIEINGQNSGITGATELPEESFASPAAKVITEVRAQYNEHMKEKIYKGIDILKDLDSGDFPATEEGKQKIKDFIINHSARSAPIFTHAYTNPRFIEDITRDKSLQEELIPVEYRPRHWHSGESLESTTGYWMVKRAKSAGGGGVFVYPNSQIGSVVDHLAQQHLLESFVIQEWVRAEPAMLDEHEQARPASLRLLVDFIYYDDERVEETFRFAYQRASPHPYSGGKDRQGNEYIDDKIVVVNKARGAQAIPASPEEVALAKEAADKICHQIAALYRRYKEDFGEEDPS